MIYPNTADIPITMKDEITEILKAKNWKEINNYMTHYASKNDQEAKGVIRNVVVNHGSVQNSCKLKKQTQSKNPTIASSNESKKPLLATIIVGSNVFDKTVRRQTI
jgi:hypothetical protein